MFWIGNKSFLTPHFCFLSHLVNLSVTLRLMSGFLSDFQSCLLIIIADELHFVVQYSILLNTVSFFNNRHILSRAHYHKSVIYSCRTCIEYIEYSIIGFFNRITFTVRTIVGYESTSSDLQDEKFSRPVFSKSIYGGVS